MGLGVFLPLLESIWSLEKEHSAGTLPLDQEFLPPIPRWVWLILGFIVFFIHFLKIADPIPIPAGDDCLTAIISIDLSEKWNWKPFYFSAQHPAPYFWINSFFFKCVPSTFTSLRSTSAFIAVLVVPLFYWALRNIFSISFGFLGACLMALSLWCFNFGRMCSFGVTILPWELVCLFLLSRFIKESEPAGQKRKLAVLGFWAGLGYLCFPTWPFVLAVVFVTILLEHFRQKPQSPTSLLWFLIFFFISFFPLLIAIWTRQYSLADRLASSLANNRSGEEHFLNAFSYFSAFFWGPLKGIVVGYAENFERLNPLLGAAFFLGFIQLFRYRRTPICRWAILASFIFFLPALVSTYLETFRVLALLPLLLSVTAWGLLDLLLTVRKERRFFVLGIFLTCSASIDSVRIVNYFSSPDQIAGQNYIKSLKNISLSRGPALILSDFLPKGNPDLFMDTYDFNAAQNPRFNPEASKWALLSANRHYYPYLKSLFPDAQWNFSDLTATDDEGMLGFIPFDDKNQGVLRRWVTAQMYFHRLNSEITGINQPRTYEIACNTLAEGQTLVQGDRFLESCYWEKAADFYYNHDFQNHYADLVNALRQAIGQGYPAAHLYYRLGSLYLRKKQFAESRKAFEFALKAEPHYTDVLEAENLLNGLDPPTHH